MGTNYYHARNICDHCGRCDERHIGKSSGGWCFALHVIPEDDIHDLPDWLPIFESGRIRDEYGAEIGPAEMVAIVCERSRVPQRTWIGYRSEADFHAQNDSEPGPNGLVRHRLDGRHCVKHGAGTWDCITSEFS